MADYTYSYTIQANDAFSNVARRVSAATKQMDRHVVALNIRMRTFGRGIEGLGKTLSLRLSAPIAALGGYALHASAKMERLQTSFSVFLNSATKGKALIEYLDKFTMKTPFNIGDVSSATKLMLGFGMSLQQVKTNLKVFGDVAAATGLPMERLAGYIGHVAAGGRITVGALTTMGRFGIPAVQSFSKTLKVSQAELLNLVSKGKITYPVFLSLMKKMTEKGGAFYQMMTKQSKTLQGSLAILHNRLFSIGRELGDQIEKQLKLKNVIWGITKALQPLYDNFSKLVEKHPLLTKIAIAFGAIAVVLPPILIAIGAFTILMSAAINPVTLIVAGITAAGAASVYLYKKFWFFRTIVKDIANLINYGIVKPMEFVIGNLHSGAYGHSSGQVVGGLVGGILHGGSTASATMDINLNAPPGVVKNAASTSKGFTSFSMSSLGKNMVKGAF